MQTSEPSNRPVRRKAVWIAAGCYLLFIVYGSLVPLDFNPRPVDVAWLDFLRTPYLVLGVDARADWIANILLYMPLAYLFSAALAPVDRSRIAYVLRTSAVFVACAVIAVAVEFTQLFFPPRTVSINDVVAEVIGSGLGIVVWLIWSGALERLWREMKYGGLPAIRAAVVLYVLAYLILSLFPYDFLVSLQEWSQKLAAGGYGFVMASGSCMRLSICSGKLLAEIIAVMPVGVLLSMVLGKDTKHPYATGALCGLALGLAIETAQLFIASGVSEGISLVTRAAGLCLGVFVQRRMRRQWLFAVRPLLAGTVLSLGLPYLLGLTWVNGWFDASWDTVEHASRSLAAVNWLPFYYHYYTTETAALVSALAVIAMYLPVGIGYWLWRFVRVHPDGDGATILPSVMAAILAGVVEGGKLFVPSKHPDPTALLIAAVGATFGFRLANYLFNWSLGARTAPSPVQAKAGSSDTTTRSARRHKAGALVAACLMLIGVGVAVANYPLSGPWLWIALTLYGLCIWRFPSMSVPAVLALLPLLDFAPWTGWVLLDEFDLLMGVTLAVQLMQLRSAERHDESDQNGREFRIGWIGIVLAATFLVSAAVGLLPLQAFDADAMAGYFSSFNSLHSLKGFLWSWALLPFLADQARRTKDLERRIVAGMTLGLSAEVAMVVWERVVFPGPFNFVDDYRITGTFPELHTGGGDIHAYLVMAIPFVVAWIACRPSAKRIAAGSVLFVLASYALAVTFTRAGYIGYLGAVAVMGIAMVISWLRNRMWTAGRIAIAAGFLLPGVALLAVIATSPYMQARLASIGTDSDTRTRHWAQAIDMMDPGAITTLFGMGLGSYPRTVLVKGREDAPATFSYRHEQDHGFVRLGFGKTLYLEQRVSLVRSKAYMLSLDLRSTEANAKLSVPLCEKSELYSFTCMEASFIVKTAGKHWEHNETRLGLEKIESELEWWRPRPVTLGLANVQSGTLVDVKNVRLLDVDGRDLIANGDFAKGGARWFFSTDDHLPWHIKNLWVQVLFEQGWFGLLVVGAAIAAALAQLAVRVWAGDLFAGTLLASLCGFLLIGLTDSLFDGPRVAMLFFLLLFLALLRRA